jgi:N-acetylmuramic acid 6-phosphate etherase
MTSPDAVTEQREERDADLDLRSTLDLVMVMNQADSTVPAAVRESADALAAAIDAIVTRLAGGGRLVYAGAGTSGRLALLDAAECGPTFGLADGRVLALEAADGTAEDDDAAGEATMAAAAVAPADAVVLVSASGSTPYTLGAARAAAAAGALTVAVVCAPDSELGRVAEHAVVADTGPEVISGSTRLKAGTAQKLVLNTISTVATNAKLRARARRAVALATEFSDPEIDEALLAAGGDAKVAIVSLLTGLPVEDARRRLADAGGGVRQALETP